MKEGPGRRSSTPLIREDRLAARTTVSLTAAEYARLSYVGGSGGTETLYVRATDGNSYSGWASTRVTSQNVSGAAPVVTANSSSNSVTEGQSIAASSLFTVTDDNNNITQYKVWDGGSGAGYFELDGNRLTARTGINLTAAEYGRLNYVGGPGGSETVYIQASDGNSWSGWVSTSVTSQSISGNPPTITANASSSSVEIGQSVAVSSLFTATDDNNNIVEYIVYDGGSGVGHFELDGNQLAARTNVTLTAAEYARLNYVGTANGRERLWVRASDGAGLSGWASTSMTSSGPVNNPPTVTSNGNTSIVEGNTVALSSLFTATDDNNNITHYDVYDGSGRYGYFELDGNILAARTTHVLTAAEYARVNYVGGASGTDTLYVRAFDGNSRSGWVSTRVTNQGVPNDPPTVTPNASSNSIQQDSSVAVSSLFTVTDDHDNVIQYRIYDGGSGAGSLELNGSTLAARTSHVLTQAEFSAINYVGGSDGTETLWVQAYDGKAWSSWGRTSMSNVGIHGAAPVVTTNADGFFILAGDFDLLTSIYTATDDNNNITAYQVWDSSGGGFVDYYNAVTGQYEVIPTRTGFEMTPTEYASAIYNAASSDSTERIWVRAYDGNSWSGWAAATIETIGASANSEALVSRGEQKSLANQNALVSSEPQINGGAQKGLQASALVAAGPQVNLGNQKRLAEGGDPVEKNPLVSVGSRGRKGAGFAQAAGRAGDLWVNSLASDALTAGGDNLNAATNLTQNRNQKKKSFGGLAQG